MTGHPWDNPDANPPADVQRAARLTGLDEELEPVPYAPPPADVEHRPHTVHRYPKARRQVSRTSWTIGDALRFLDPAPPRRTLSRWLRALTPDGTASLPQGGPPARTYPAKEIMARHARWASRGTHE